MVRQEQGDSVRRRKLSKKPIAKPIKKPNQGEDVFMLVCRKMVSRLVFGATIAGALAFGPARAEDPVKIGLILPMTGGQASTGKQIDNAIKLYMQQHGDSVAGRKIEITLQHHGPLPDNTTSPPHEHPCHPN